MQQSLITIAYIAASALFILSLGGEERRRRRGGGMFTGLSGLRPDGALYLYI